MSSGAVVLDTNALKAFADVAARGRLRGSLRAVDLALRLSTTNVIEILKCENPRVRARLIEIARALGADSQLMPGPTGMLKQAAESLLRGESSFSVAESGLEWILEEPQRITDLHLAEARRLWQEQEQVWNDAHDGGRQLIRDTVRRNHGRDPWGSVGAFLDQQWLRADQLDSFIERTWAALKLPGRAPVEPLLRHDIWRMYFEAQGAVIYERTVAAQKPTAVETADVYQLVYLTGVAKRILVTDDAAFTRVASAVLDGRHLGWRIMTPTAFAGVAV